MRLRAVLENARVREVLPIDTSEADVLGAVEARVRIWLAAIFGSVRDGGVCKSFTVSLHVDGPDCDHEARS